MLQHLSEQRKALSLYSVEHGGIVMLTKTEMEVVDCVCAILKPFYDATLEISRDMDMSHNYYYYYQVQGLMYITGRLQCCFIVYTLCDRYHILIARDDDFSSHVCEKLDVFFNDVYKPVVLDKFLYRSTDM